MNQSTLTRAIQFMQAQRFGEAKRLLAELANTAPDFATLRYCGLAHQYDGDLQKAVHYFERCSQLKPREPEPYIDAGTCLANLNHYQAAKQQFERATKFCPTIAMAHNNLGFACYKLGDFVRAEQSLRRAIKLDASLALAFKNLGHVMQDSNRWPEAATCYRRALRLNPDIPEVLSALVYTLRTLCDWELLDDYEAQLLARSEHYIAAGHPSPIVPFIAIFLKLEQKQLYAIVRSQTLAESRLTAHIAPPTKMTHPNAIRCDFDNGDKLRIGYLSSAFRSHATSHLAHTLFNLHDKSRYDVYIYAGTAPDLDNAQIQHIANSATAFKDLSGMDDSAAAATINEDQLHLLVDMDGHINNNRQAILHLRPAPVQVNFLGYPGTIGSDAIDYIIGDAIVTPPELEPWLQEKPARLPHCYQFNNYPALSEAATPTRAELGLPDDAVIYCCFNITRKIEPEVFGCWMRILQKTDKGILWFLIDAEQTRSLLEREAAKYGIDACRLHFAERCATDKHLARQRVADLFLDTFYCNAHTTASDALWCGLPVITKLGRTFANRVAASLVTAAGLPECVLHSNDDYESKAIELGNNPNALAALRERISEKSHLFDSAGYVQNLECAYAKMWENHISNAHSAFNVLAPHQPPPL